MNSRWNFLFQEISLVCKHYQSKFLTVFSIWNLFITSEFWQHNLWPASVFWPQRFIRNIGTFLLIYLFSSCIVLCSLCFTVPCPRQSCSIVCQLRWNRLEIIEGKTEREKHEKEKRWNCLDKDSKSVGMFFFLLAHWKLCSSHFAFVLFFFGSIILSTNRTPRNTN